MEKLTTKDISAVRTVNGLLLSTIHDGQYKKRLYIGYSKRDAIRLFKASCIATTNAP